MINIYNNLPEVENLNVLALAKSFKSTTNSYKYIFLLSILDILFRREFSYEECIYFREIFIEMLANAWYPHNYFHLSFGTQDKITHKLDSLDLQFNKIKDPDKTELREVINKQNLDDVTTFLRRYVPFRLITPFFDTELKGVDRDYEIDRIIPQIVQTYFELRKPLYCFDSVKYKDCQGIILHSDWVSYFKNNYSIVRGWISWEWLKYMQRCNPNTPAISNKLFIPQKRESLSTQTKYWQVVLENTKAKCVYSKIDLTPDNLSLDHYLPWSFVAHNQLWNLIPTFQSINSAKSNKIPSTSLYFEEFVSLQHLGLRISYENMKEHIWNNYIESYLLDLRIANKYDLLNLEILTKAYETTAIPLISLAITQGFIADWSYSRIQESGVRSQK